MRFIRSTQIQKCKGKKKGKYHILLEVTDYDINMFEALAWYEIEKEEQVDYDKYVQKVFAVFQKLWRRYDE